MARFKSANDIINQVAIETGLEKKADVFTTQDAAFPQLIALANSCGMELIQHQPWEHLNAKFTQITTSTDDGKYALPEDYAYMIDQTNWEQSNNRPMANMSAQDWTYAIGSTDGTDTIHVSFRINQNEFWLFPYAEGHVTPPDGLEITFEYISRYWVNGNLASGLTPTTQANVGSQDIIAEASDMVLFEPYLFERLLKVRFLEARGFDTSAANQQLESAYQSWSGKDKGASILNVGGNRRGFRYLNGCNVGDTGYGI